MYRLLQNSSCSLLEIVICLLTYLYTKLFIFIIFNDTECRLAHPIYMFITEPQGF